MSQQKNLLVLDKDMLQRQLKALEEEHGKLDINPMDDEYERDLKRKCNLYGQISAIRQMFEEGGTGEDIFDAGREHCHTASETILGIEIQYNYDYPTYSDYLKELAKK